MINDTLKKKLIKCYKHHDFENLSFEDYLIDEIAHLNRKYSTMSGDLGKALNTIGDLQRDIAKLLNVPGITEED